MARIKNIIYTGSISEKEHDFNESEMLQYALENGMIDINTIKTQIEMKERNKYLDMHPYDIWEGKNGLWYTYIPDAVRGRILKKRKTQKDVEDCIVDFWKENSDKSILDKKRRSATLKAIFPVWLKQKQIHSASSSAIKRILCDWNRFYETQPKFINKPISQFTKMELDNWAHEMIKKYDMTKKMYYNMSMIIRQCLDYAADEEVGIVSDNLFRKVKINTRLFRREKKKDSSTQVYTLEEQIILSEEMEKTFKRNVSNTIPLAVMLAFELGVRVGELCALKFSDIEGDRIYIQRQQVVKYKVVDDYKMKHDGFTVVEYTKTEESNRDIILTSRAVNIISLVKQINDATGEPNDNDFIFVRNNTFIRCEAVERTIKRACKRAGIPYKSLHKIRKTYISSLIDAGLNIDEVRRLAGHVHERTTLGNYCFNRLTDSQTRTKIEDGLDPQKVIKKVIKSNQKILITNTENPDK